jgi:hypothetical protein
MKLIFVSSLVLGLISFQATAGGNSSDDYASNGVDATRLYDLKNSLRHHSADIISIRQSLSGKAPVNQQTSKEGEYSDSVLFVLSEIHNDVDDLVVKQNLLGAMESTHGKTRVAEHKKSDTKNFKAKCGNYQAELNLSLGKISDGALAFEVKSARDDVVKICDIVQNWE